MGVILFLLHRITALPLPHRGKRGGAGVIKAPFCTVSVISVMLPPSSDPRGAVKIGIGYAHLPPSIGVALSQRQRAHGKIETQKEAQSWPR